MTSETRTGELQVRAATADDAEAVAAIIERVVAEPRPVALPRVLNRDEVQQWQRRLGDQGCLIVATLSADVVGFGAIDYNTEQPDTCLLGVWVLPDHRRQGIATALGADLLDFAREAGYKRVRGRLPEGNEPALAFLSGLGALAPLQNPELRFELPL